MAGRQMFSGPAPIPASRIAAGILAVAVLLAANQVALPAGLLPPPARTSANYRAYGSDHLARLSFIRRARDLGFSLEAVRELLTLSDDKTQSCEAVDGIARIHLNEIDRKIGDLTALRTELDRVIGSCRHGTVADCKIIETLGPRPN